MRWPAADVADWTHNTMEQARIQTRQLEMYATISPLHNVTQVQADSVNLSCIYTDRTHDLPCGTSIPVTMREATDVLFAALTEQDGIWKCLMRIGDCLAPGTIARRSMAVTNSPARSANRRTKAYCSNANPYCLRWADMARDPRYEVQFESVRIEPVTARNRFYQIPHCNGMGRSFPSLMTEMRRTKAEGSWAVICTEEIEIHRSSGHSLWAGRRIWTDDDIPVLVKMCDGTHEFGSLAGAEINHAGQMAANRYSRDVPLAPSSFPVTT